MAHHLVRRHSTPTTRTLRSHRSQPLKDLGPVAASSECLHVAALFNLLVAIQPARRGSIQLARRGGTSLPEELFAAGFAERGQRPLAARFRFQQKRLEDGKAPQRVEGPAG